MLRVLVVLALSCLAFVGRLSAQEFRVYTQVWDKQSTNPEPISRCLTVWHAGKVYDSIYDAHEVTIMEPAQRRIWVVSTSRNLKTCVDFDELKHMLREAEDRLSERLQELDKSSKGSREVTETLRFQLHPQFETSFNPDQQRLRLASSRQSYEVQGQRQVAKATLEAYLNSADWLCQLNFVLHPQPVFPTARLELNQQLRKADLMPTLVALRAKLDSPLHLEARHQLTWSLETLDRTSINTWESLIKDSKIQKVPLAEYQRTMYSQQTAKAR